MAEASGFAVHGVAGIASGMPTSLASAFSMAGHGIKAGFFSNVAWACIAVAIWIAGWVAQFIVGWIIGQILMCGHSPGFYSDHDKKESAGHPQHVPGTLSSSSSRKKKEDDFQVIVDDGTRKPIHTPIWSTVDAKGIPRLLPRHVAASVSDLQRKASANGHHDASPLMHQTMFKQVVIPFIPDKKQWHGHGRSLYESYVRLVILSVRVAIVLVATAISFSVAGIDMYAVVTGMGIISITFSFAASGMLANVFGAMYMYGTGKIELHDYISVAQVNGEVTAFRPQWLELTDDSQPWKGRMIHQIPNRVPLETIVTVYPNGPGLAILKTVKDDLAMIDAWVATNPLALQQIQEQYFTTSSPPPPPPLK